MDLAEYHQNVQNLPCGKRIGTALYVQREALGSLGGGLAAMLDQVVARFQISAEFNLVKFQTDEARVSFLAYPEFESDPHPALRKVLAIDLATGAVRRMDYANNINPPILHRKEQMLPPNHPRQAEFQALTQRQGF